MTFTELAKRAGLSRSTFYKAVRNSRGLRPETIAQLDQALELKRPGFPGGSGYWIPIKGWSVRYAS
ncbi:cro/C1-type HTH DNA-binding domain protein [Mycobacterium sp. MAC_080597_8934]|uniref:helix-turn-helix domain-containing protein n=3 Tax=unclassified Mycobacterium avium complex (MAC) TaxID=2750822 RepID=UPI00044D80E5|nr:cro/C1-type HTH DNA-binding domain protein [Mycobacterium sp. MAC_011194_8550]ETZ67000.1 cro/C1-type HTH DNA-binding domain protein [Mycobacterium sp. MAC_080597_8934]